MVPWYWLLWPFALALLAFIGVWAWAALTETEEEREARGMREIDSALVKSFGESLADGQALVEKDPAYFRTQVNGWADNPRPLSDSEDAALAYDRMKLSPQHKRMLMQENAERVFRLPLGQTHL